MNCTNCGTQLPPTAKACPQCGTLTPFYYSEAGSSPIDATVEAGPAIPVYQPGGLVNAQGWAPPGPGQAPSTLYGSNPYANQQQSPYEVVAPPPPPPLQNYYVTPPPPQPPSRDNRTRIGLIIGIGLLIVIIVAGALFALLRSASTVVTPTPTPAIHATGQTSVPPTPTANNSQNPYPPNTGTLVLNDPLTDNSRGYKWDESSFSGTDSCGFTGGAYHIIEKTGLICIPEAKNLTLSNFAFEANIKIVQGDNGGIAFRINQVNKTFYAFDITKDGGYTLSVYTTKYVSLSQGTNAVINKGLNVPNLLAVVANGNLITIYVNNQIIDSVHDNTYSQGQIGVLSFSSSTLNDVIASNARVWQL